MPAPPLAALTPSALPVPVPLHPPAPLRLLLSLLEKSPWPPASALVQLAIAALCGGAGWIAFLRAGRAPSALDLSSRPVIGAAVTVLTAIALVAAIAVMKLGDGADDDAEAPLAVLAGEEPRFIEGPPAQTATMETQAV